MRVSGISTRGNLSLAVAFLALLVALSGPAQAALGKGAVQARHLADGAVKTAKIHNGAVTSPKLRDGSVVSSKLAVGSVTTNAIVDGTIRLHDLGGGLANQTRAVASDLAIPANTCRGVFLRGFIPIPPGLLGSMLVGTITTATGGAVVDNDGYVLPTFVTESKQGGAQLYLVVCAGGSPQTIPAGSIVTWSTIAP